MGGDYEIQKAYESILDSDFAQAIHWFKRAIQRSPHNAEYHYKISITYARSSKLKQALQHANRACELDSQQVEYQFHRDRLHARQVAVQARQLLEEMNTLPYKYKIEANEQALELLRESVQLDPLFEEAWILKAMAYAQLEQFHAAIEAVEQAIELNPQHDIALKLLANYKSQIT